MNPPALELDLPEGAFVESEVRIVAYLNARGERRSFYRISPDVDFVTLYGLVCRVAHDMLHDLEETPLVGFEEGEE